MNRLVIPSYILFVLLLVLFSYFFVDQNFFYLNRIYTGFAFSNRQIVTIIYSLSVLILFGFYGFFLKNKFYSKFLIGITCVVLLFSYSAMLSQDIFNYLTTAKVIFKYHENPYLIMPIEFAGDSNLLFTQAANKIALYGPFWIILSGLPYFLGFGNFLLSFFNFKLLAVLFYIGTLWIIKKLTKNNFSVIIFAFNPLIIIEILIGGHNDIVMMFLALLSFFLLKRKKILLSCMFLFSSIFIKYSTIFLIPVFLLVLYKILKKRSVDWEKIYLVSWISMFIIFLLSALRVEIYPWYATWFLVFTPLIPQRKMLLTLSLVLSFGLLLRYIPFMLLGTHFGITPLVKSLVTFLPVSLVFIYAYFKKFFA